MSSLSSSMLDRCFYRISEIGESRDPTWLVPIVAKTPATTCSRQLHFCCTECDGPRLSIVVGWSVASSLSVDIAILPPLAFLFLLLFYQDASRRTYVWGPLSGQVRFPWPPIDP